MNIEQVVSLELAARLKELGVKQTSLFCWSELESVPSGREYKVYYKDCYSDTNYLDIAAFTASELGEMLPASIVYEDYDLTLGMAKGVDNWITLYYEEDSSPPIDFRASTLADSMALMLIYLIENGYVKV